MRETVTTLIVVSNGEGIVGRCDEKCYGATQPTCACICGGRNHGRGEKNAIENTREMMIGEEANKLLKNYEQAHRFEAANISLGKALEKALNSPLFPLEK